MSLSNHERTGILLKKQSWSVGSRQVLLSNDLLPPQKTETRTDASGNWVITCHADFQKSSGSMQVLEDANQPLSRSFHSPPHADALHFNPPALVLCSLHLVSCGAPMGSASFAALTIHSRIKIVQCCRTIQNRCTIAINSWGLSLPETVTLSADA